MPRYIPRGPSTNNRGGSHGGGRPDLGEQALKRSHVPINTSIPPVQKEWLEQLAAERGSKLAIVFRELIADAFEASLRAKPKA